MTFAHFLLYLNLVSVSLILTSVWVLIARAPVAHRFWRNVLIVLLLAGFCTRLTSLYTIIFVMGGTILV